MDNDSTNDITAVMKMVKDYKRFLNTPVSMTVNDRFKKSDATQPSDFFASFNQSCSFDNSSISRKRSFDTNYLTLTKDEKADIIAERSKVARLESELNTSILEKKKLQIQEEARNKEASTRLVKEREESDTMRRRYLP